MVKPSPKWKSLFLLWFKDIVKTEFYSSEVLNLRKSNTSIITRCFNYANPPPFFIASNKDVGKLCSQY